MKVGDLFEKKVSVRIDPVVKVGDVYDEKKLAEELRSYVVTPSIEEYLESIFDHYTDTIRTETQEIGVWISGYFGSGKSYLAKVMSQVLENRVLMGEPASQHFQTRIPVDSVHRGGIERSLSRLEQLDTSVMGFNLLTLSGADNTTLARMLLTEYYAQKGYTRNVIFARVIEAELDRLGRLGDFRAAVERESGKAWADISANPNFNKRALYAGAVAVAPESFPTPEDVDAALKGAHAGEIYNTQFLIETIRADIKRRESETGRPQRFMFVLDEFGFWAGTDTGRLGELEALVEEAAEKTKGSIWICITTHGDMGSVIAEARMNEADQKKITSRFRFKPALTTENIELVLEDRLFKKTAAGRAELEGIYGQTSGTMRAVGEPSDTSRVLQNCTAERFATYYPFLPYQIDLIPEVVKSLRSKGGRGEQLSGSTRTLLAVVQDIMRSGHRSYLDESVGVLVSFDEVFHNLAGEGEVQPQIRDDVRRIVDVVPDATDATQRVAQCLYLIGHLEFVPSTIDNISRMMVESTDDSVASIRTRVEPEVLKLIGARLAVKNGDEYEFLTGEVRTFEDEVASAQGDLRRQDRSQRFQKFFVIEPGGRKNYIEWLGEASAKLQGRDFTLKLSIDGVHVTGTIGDVAVEVVSPLDSTPESVNHAENSTVGTESANRVMCVMDRPVTFDDNLSRYLAMRQTIESWKSDSSKSEEARKLASDKESSDLKRLRDAVVKDLKRALQDGHYVFRGSSERLIVPPGITSADAFHERLTSALEAVYPKYRDLPVRISQDQKAVEDALAGKHGNQDLKNLAIFDAAGQIKPAAVLIDAFEAFVSARQNVGERVAGSAVSAHLSGPPYGWDPNAARVAAAVLVRSGRLTVVVQNKKLTNPDDEALKRAVRVARDFGSCVLELEVGDIDQQQLRDVRELLIGLTGNRQIVETSAAISQAGDLFAEGLLSKASNFEVWRSGSGLNPGDVYVAAVSAWSGVRDFVQPNQRVRFMHEHLEELKAAAKTVSGAVEFQETRGIQYGEMRQAYSALSSVSHLLPADGPAANFVTEFSLAKTAGTFFDSEVWTRLRTRQSAAEVELRDCAKERLDSALALLRDAAERLAVLVDAECLDTELLEPLVRLDTELQNLSTDRDRLNSPERVAATVRATESAIRGAIGAKQPSPGPDSKPKRIRMRDLAPLGMVRTEEEWASVVEQLDRTVREALSEGRLVEFDA